MEALEWLAVLAAAMLSIWAVVVSYRRGLFSGEGAARDRRLVAAMTCGSLLLLVAWILIGDAVSRERIKKIDAYLGAKKDGAVPPGEAALHVVIPRHEETDSYKYISVMLYPLDRCQVAKREERSGGKTVTVWSGIARDYAEDLAGRLRTLKVDAWVADAAPYGRRP